MNIVGKNFLFELSSEDACMDLAKKIGKMIQSPTLNHQGLHIWLIGDLGSGKTTLVRYILRTLGYEGKVKSPTYNLCEPYSVMINDSDIAINHFDLYRMNHPLEWEEAGFKDILNQSGINFIEWPEKAENTLPSADLIIRLQYISETVRKGSIEGVSTFGNQLLRHIS
jgi:tRNA threonylcarbamoyladenosine biosynthesis protein TsaE